MTFPNIIIYSFKGGLDPIFLESFSVKFLGLIFTQIDSINVRNLSKECKDMTPFGLKMD